MSLEQQVAALVVASNNLTGEVAGKMGQIDARVATKVNELEAWKVANSPEQRFVRDIKIGGSKDYFYPVWWRFDQSGMSGCSKIAIVRNFQWNSDDHPLTPNAPHQAGLLLELEGGDNAWGGDPNFLEVKRFMETYNPTVSHVSHRMYCKQYRVDVAGTVYGGIADGTFGANNMQFSGVYLRGGGLTYRIISNFLLADFAFHDGVGNTRDVGIEVSANVKWIAEPVAFASRNAPVPTLNAYVDAPAA